METMTAQTSVYSSKVSLVLALFLLYFLLAFILTVEALALPLGLGTLFLKW